MSAALDIHSQDRVTRSKQAEQDDLVSRAAGMRLHIGIACTESGFGALDSQAFNGIDELAARMETGAGVAFRRDIRRHGSFTGQHRRIGYAGGRYHCQSILLALVLSLE